MVGQAVLREALLDPDVSAVLAIVRKPTGQQHAKLTERVLIDPGDLSSIATELHDYDACLFCLGVSAAGMSEADYRRVTYDLTLSAAKTLVEQAPGMTFIYVSGAGTDSSAQGRSMWARVKGETENALLALPFRAAYMFRPGFIQPMHGIRSRTPFYNAVYTIMGPLFPVLKSVAANYVTTSEWLGRAMLIVAKHGHAKRVLEQRDINEIAQAVAKVA
jgi:uncharacterized protein YbjT (DUF2867 family)